MRFAVALLLLLAQAQPLLGAALCVRDSMATSTSDCGMPEHRTADVGNASAHAQTTVADADDPAGPNDCPLARACLASANAVLTAPVVLAVAAVPEHGLVALSTALPPGETQAPLQRPPIV